LHSDTIFSIVAPAINPPVTKKDEYTKIPYRRYFPGQCIAL